MLHVFAHDLHDDPAVLAEDSLACCIVSTLVHLGVICTVVLDEHSVVLVRDVAPSKKLTAVIEDVWIDRRRRETGGLQHDSKFGFLRRFRSWIEQVNALTRL